MKTILVLGDHPDLADAIQTALNAEKYRVIHRVDSSEAEPFLQPGGIDLCVIDVELSNVQGLWTIEKVRRRLPTSSPKSRKTPEGSRVLGGPRAVVPGRMRPSLGASAPSDCTASCGGERHACDQPRLTV